MGQPFFEARSACEGALVAEARGDAELAVLHRSRADAIFERLGVVPHVVDGGLAHDGAMAAAASGRRT